MDQAAFQDLLRRRRRARGQTGKDTSEDCVLVRPFAGRAREELQFFKKVLRRWRKWSIVSRKFREERAIAAEREHARDIARRWELWSAYERERQRTLHRRHVAIRSRLLPRGGAGAVYWLSEWRMIKATWAQWRCIMAFAAERRAWEAWRLGDD